jgi:hypothetical protein
MKLFVHDKKTSSKIHLNFVASTRSELATTLGSPWFSLGGSVYHVHEVSAESNDNSTTAGAVVGGLIGLLGGPIGVLIGGAVGGALGNENDKSETSNVRKFNSSRV